MVANSLKLSAILLLFSFVGIIAVTAQPTDDAVETSEDTSVNFNVTDNDLGDVDIASVDLNVLAAGIQPSYTDANGNWSVNGTGEVTFIPAENFSGVALLTYAVNDSGGAPLGEATIAVEVIAVNDAPVITGQQALSTLEDQAFQLLFTHLTVEDPDNVYPDDFTLSLQPGANYTFSGTTITPATNFAGVLTIPVRVNDGQVNSANFNISLTVTPVNDAPTITGQTSLTILEDQVYTLQLTHFLVTDPDNTYPNGFSLLINPGSNYTSSGATITPAANFNGQLVVKVAVSDGSSNSAVFDCTIQVTPVNDAPIITGQKTVAFNEDQARNILLTDLIVSDVDNIYPTGFSLTVLPGSDYTATGTSVSPASNFHGTLQINVQVNDGGASSTTFVLTAIVVPVNDAPIIAGQNPISIQEDQSRLIQFADLVVTDVDNAYPSGFTIKILPGTNYTFSGQTILPNNNFTGLLTVNVVVNDGSVDSNVFGLQISVGAQNDAPVITGQRALAIAEESFLDLRLTDLTVTDPDGDYPNGYTLTILPGANYTHSGSVVTPVKDFDGTLIVNVKVNDGTFDSNVFGVQVTVNPINDPPGFSLISNQVVAENSGNHTITITGITRGPTFEAAQVLTFVASSGNTNVVPTPTIDYSGSGTTALLHYTVLNNVSGTVSITLTAIDNGSNVPPNQNTYSQTFQITVTEVNSPPTIDAVSIGPIAEDAPLQQIPLTGITAGSGESQGLTLAVSTDHPEWFEVLAVQYTSPQSSGILQLQPKPNVYGNPQITITVTDDGPSSPPNQNTTTKSFVLVIQPVNDPPVFRTEPVRFGIPGQGYVYDILVEDVDGEIPVVSGMIPSWLVLTNTGSGSYRLSGSVPGDAIGSVAVTLQAVDGSNIPVLQTYSIFFNSPPVVTSFELTLVEDQVYRFRVQDFDNSFSDPDGGTLESIQFVKVASPGKGILRVNNAAVGVGDEILRSEFDDIQYIPSANFQGRDTLKWKGSDGTLISLSSANIFLTFTPSNDAPSITFLETDTLKYEVGDELPVLITTNFQAEDADGDSLVSAEIGFRRPIFQPNNDLLIFQDYKSIKGAFDKQSGILLLSGKASVADYVEAIRTVQYNYLQLEDLKLDTRNVYITLSDGKAFSETRDRPVELVYTFVDLDIPNAFTPNGDAANAYWKISSPKGVEQYNDAIIRVFDKRGKVVFESVGIDTFWDGTYQGEVMPVDTYFYTIELNYNKVKYRGTVTILR